MSPKGNPCLILAGLAAGICIATAAHALDDATISATLKNDQKLFRIPRVTTDVTVDGVLDEAMWADAVKVDANIEVRPAENVPAPVTTEALLAYDDENIYVGIRAYDPHPEQIQAHIRDRDTMGSDDWVLILFDTFNDQRRSYDFFCNAYGIQSDNIETSNGDGDWDGIWYSEGRITPEGYVVEMVIPFNTISFQNVEGEQVWTFDVVRSYPRNVRYHIGAFPRDRNNNCYLCQAHRLVGFDGVKPGKNIEITPTLSGGYAQERESLDDNAGYGPMKESSKSFDPGVSATWNVTPNMVLSATLNPDFSQVEADAAQMDINNKFPLYYSEKRPFFTEGGDLYRVNNLVHTRTLADPDWGVKLTGKSGKNTIGMFTVRDTVTPLMFSDTEGADTTTMSRQSQGTVIRYRRDLFSSSTIGILLNDREGEDYYNRFASVDAILRPTKKDYMELKAGGSRTRYPGSVADEYDQKEGEIEGGAYAAYYQHSTDSYRVYGNYERFGPGLRNDLGFISRTGYTSNRVGAQYNWNADGGHWYTSIYIGGNRNESFDWDGRSLQRKGMAFIDYNGPLRSFVEFYGNGGHLWYEGDRYDSNAVGFYGSFYPLPTTYVSLGMDGGDRIDYTNNKQAKSFSVNPYVSTTLGQRVVTSLEHNHEYLDIDAGRLYTGDVTNGRVTYQFNRRCFVRLILQHVRYKRNVANYNEDERDDTDPLTRRIYSQLLFSYKLNPRTVFFLGYSDNYHTRDRIEADGRMNDDIIQTNRAVFAKIGYAWQL